MSATYFIHVMGKCRPRHVLPHWGLQNFQGFVRPISILLFDYFSRFCSQALHENQMFKTKHVGDIFVLWYFRDLKILKFLVNRRDVKCENISFLKFVFTLWVWSFVLGLSCDTGQSFRAASCGGSPHQSIPHTRIQPGPRFRGRWLWILSDTRPVAVASQHPSYGKTSAQLKL